MTLAAGSTKDRVIYGKIGADLLIFDYLLNRDGSEITAGTATIRAEFSPYEFFETGPDIPEVFNAIIHNPAKGTPTSVDKRWNPAQHDNQGYNMELRVRAELWTQVGRYRVFFQYDSLAVNYDVVISD